MLSNAVKTQMTTTQHGVPVLVPELLKTFRQWNDVGPKLALANDQLITDVVYSTMLRLEEILDQDESTAVDQTRLNSLVAIFDTFGNDIFADAKLASVGTIKLVVLTGLISWTGD